MAGVCINALTSSVPLSASGGGVPSLGAFSAWPDSA